MPKTYRNRAMRYENNIDDGWVSLPRADRHLEIDSRLDGRFIDEMFAFTHCAVGGQGDVIHAYMGTFPTDIETDEGIFYDWRQHDNVGEALATQHQYFDFYDVLEGLGFDREHDIVTEAVSQLQQMVDAARVADGITS